MTVKDLIEKLQKCPQDMFIEIYSEAEDITSKIKYVSCEDMRFNIIYLVTI